MENMQQKIQSYEYKDAQVARDKNLYNDLLIKYNTMVYKMNTCDTTSQGGQQEQQAYDGLRNKMGSVSKSRSNERGRNRTPNSDLAFEGPKTDKFMIKTTDPGMSSQEAYIEDNCENQNPNYLRDPRLTNLENENRFLKEEMKKLNAKVKFYKAKYNSVKANIGKSAKGGNWASVHGPSNFASQRVRSSSACNIHKNLKPAND